MKHNLAANTLDITSYIYLIPRFRCRRRLYLWGCASRISESEVDRDTFREASGRFQFMPFLSTCKGSEKPIRRELSTHVMFARDLKLVGMGRSDTVNVVEIEDELCSLSRPKGNKNIEIAFLQLLYRTGISRF